MKRIRIVGLCFAAALGLSALVATSAFATPPVPEYGKCIKKATKTGEGFSDSGCTKHVASLATYEWSTAVAGVTFTGKMKPETKATLETIKKEKVVCTTETDTGTYLNPKEVETTPTFKGCEALTKKCTTAGAPEEGEIQVQALQGELGIEKKGEKEGKEEPKLAKLANNLYRQGNRGGEIVNFLCSGFEIRVEGTVLFPVKANKTETKPLIKFAATAGKQKPEKFEGGPKETLASSFGGAPFAQSGQTITVEQTNASGIEANSVL